MPIRGNTPPARNKLSDFYDVTPDLCYTFATMSPRARLLLIIIGLIVLAAVINLMRTRRLKEEYALLWLAAALTLIATPILIDPLDSIAFFLGIEYPPALFLGLGIIGLLLIIFQLSLVISKFSDQIRVLTQEVAILRSRLDRLEQSGAGANDIPQETDSTLHDDNTQQTAS